MNIKNFSEFYWLYYRNINMKTIKKNYYKTNKNIKIKFIYN